MTKKIDKIIEITNNIRLMTSDLDMYIKDMIVPAKQLRNISSNEAESIFGIFKYTNIGIGRIKIDPEWQGKNIKLLSFGFHKVWIHYLLFPQVAYIFGKIYAEHLQDELDLQGGGGFCARYQNWVEDNPLSLHSWGIAIDLNPNKYPFNSDKNPHSRIIEIFEEGGFFWGGNFKTVKDPMHFQFSHFIL